MALKLLPIQLVDVHQMAAAVRSRVGKVVVVDCRSFLEYNENHVATSINISCSKLMKRRLQQGKVCMKDLLIHCRIEADDSWDMIVYDQGSVQIDKIATDSFVYVLLKKLVPLFRKVHYVTGGFSEFQSIYPDLCEDKTRNKFAPHLTSLSQPCLPITNLGPTRILPFLYLGSEEDSRNRDLLRSHGITYELNVSTSCPQPDFIQDSHFLRVPVNDSHSDRLLPYFYQACQFIDKVRESSGCVLVHCLAGISRSPTVAIAYVMRHLRLTCEEAYRYVKSKRVTISPNFNFLGQLLEHEKQLKNEDILEKSPAEKKLLSSEGSNTASNASVATAPVMESANKSKSRRLRTGSLALPLCPGANPGANPSDLSPTTALARLHFEPTGKENWAGAARITMENFSGKESLSEISFVPCKTSSQQGRPRSRGQTTPTTPTQTLLQAPPELNSPQSCSPRWLAPGAAPPNFAPNFAPSFAPPFALGLPWDASRDYLRSDSLSTSGVGSELSDVDLPMDAMQGSVGDESSGEHDSLGVDDGVFCEGHSPQPLHYQKTPPLSRPQQFNQSETVIMRERRRAAADSVRSPEKRKSSEIPLSPERQQRGSEKRRSLVGDELGGNGGGGGNSGPGATSAAGGGARPKSGTVVKCWVESKPLLPCCCWEDNKENGGLYRVRSCPGSIDSGNEPRTTGFFKTPFGVGVRAKSWGKTGDNRNRFSCDYGDLRRTDITFVDVTNMGEPAARNGGSSLAILCQ